MNVDVSLNAIFAATDATKEVPAEATSSEVFGYVSCTMILLVIISLVVLDIPTFVDNVRFMLRNLRGSTNCTS